MSNEQTSRRQGGLLPFFVLTFLITWGIAAFLFLFPGAFESLFGNISMSSPIFVLAVAAPTISATLITYVRERWPGLRDLYARIVLCPHEPAHGRPLPIIADQGDIEVQPPTKQIYEVTALVDGTPDSVCHGREGLFAR